MDSNMSEILFPGHLIQVGEESILTSAAWESPGGGDWVQGHFG